MLLFGYRSNPDGGVCWDVKKRASLSCSFFGGVAALLVVSGLESVSAGVFVVDAGNRPSSSTSELP